MVTVTYVWAVGNAVAYLLFWNPHTNGCGAACPVNLLLIDDSTRMVQILGWVTAVTSTCIALTVVGLAAQYWWRASGYARRAMTWVMCIAALIAAYVIYQNVETGLNLNISNLYLYGIGPVILLAAPVAFAAGMLRAWRTQGSVGMALVDLEPGQQPPDRLRGMLAKALGDPTLQLAFPAPDGNGLVDTGGQPVDIARLPRGRTITQLDPTGVSVLVHDEELRHEPGLVRVTAAAAGLALEHVRLRAQIEEQLEQVRASRARIVEAGDIARRQLERDLHDGAQQRLVTLTLALGMARGRAEGVDPELESLLEAASKEAAKALLELRELARGIHPAVLTEAGLSGAVQALVGRSPVTTTITAMPEGRYPAPIEATAYFVVSEALANMAKHAPAANAHIAIRQLENEIVVEVDDDGGGAHGLMLVLD